MKKMTLVHFILAVLLSTLCGCATPPKTMPAGGIAVLDPANEEERLTPDTLFPGANGIKYDPRTGRLFVTERFQGSRIYEVDPAGRKPARLLIDKDVIAVPEGFGFDPESGDLIISDTGSGKILRVDPDSGKISTIAENFSLPIVLTIGSDNVIYIPEVGTGAVYKFSIDGAKREKIAQLPPGVDNLAGTPAGRLFVTSNWGVATGGGAEPKKLFFGGINQPMGF